jgi:hypothetical protein
MHRTHRIIAAAIAIALCASSTAVAQQDLRSPDAIDAATPRPSQVQDLRSPDAVDAATERPSQDQDLRSPDAKDAAESADRAPLQPPTRVRIVEIPSDGFAWADAGIGAAAMLAVALLGLGLAGMHGRRRRRVPLTTR